MPQLSAPPVIDYLHKVARLAAFTRKAASTIGLWSSILKTARSPRAKSDDSTMPLARLVAHRAGY
jgi:hypothetical protein